MIQKGLITNYNNYSEYNMFSANVRTHYLSSEELFNLREEISFKIFKNPQRLLRIIRLNPLWFLKMILVHIWNHPSEITGYLKGMFD